MTITGLWFLRKPYEKDLFVRFHAWQAVFGLIAVGVAFTAVGIFHGMAADIWSGFSLLGWPMAVQAYRGKKVHAPVIRLLVTRPRGR